MTEEISSKGDPSGLDPGYHAPNFQLFVDNRLLQVGVKRLITSVTFESADGIADVMRIEMVDPRMVQPVAFSSSSDGITNIPTTVDTALLGLSDIDLFQPGHEVHVKMGYGVNLHYVGRAIIRRVRKLFPEGGGIPTMSITAYSKDSIMMDNQPDTSKFRIVPIETVIIGETKDEAKARRKADAPKRAARKKAEQAAKIRQFKSYLLAIRQKAKSYKMELDIDLPINPILVGRKFTHNVSLSDFDLLKCMSHVTGFLFWVDATEKGQWVLHFRDPAKLRKVDKHFDPPDIDFIYNQHNQSTLLSFEPEWYISGAITVLKVIIRDEHAGVKREIEIDVQNNEDAPSYKPAETRPLQVSGTTAIPGTVDLIASTIGGFESIGNFQTSQDIKIVIGEYSWSPIVNRKFKTTADLVAWARQWYRRHRENFVLANGTCIGVPRLYARQTHAISGVGSALKGDYYFTRVAHKCTAADGYKIDFSCRKSPKQFRDE